MFEDAVGRLIGGALWGLGAGVALTLVRGSGAGARPIAKTLVKGYVVVAERVQETVAEARETIEDARAEVRAERTGRRSGNGMVGASPGGAGEQSHA